MTKKNIYNVKYVIELTENNKKVKSKENLNLLASNSEEAKKILKRSVKELFNTKDKVRISDINVNKGIKGSFRASNVFNVPNNIDLSKVANR